MKRSFLIVAALVFLSACGAKTTPGIAPVIPESQSSAATAQAPVSADAVELANLDYSTGAITVFRASSGKASIVTTFKASANGSQGLAMDSRGRIYTAVTSSNSKPCSACVEVFAQNGDLVARLAAPKLQSAQNPPFLTDVSVDAAGNVYVSDYGQQAVYVFPPIGGTLKSPFVIVQSSSNAASVLATPNGANVFVSGGCGFASVRPYTKNTISARAYYQAGSCFGIATIALLGAATENDEAILMPIDGVPGLVAVSSPSGGSTFQTPGGFLASLSGVALTVDGSIAYVADHSNETVYAFARPAGGWVKGGKPKLLATYKGFKNLDVIAVRQ